MNPIDIGGAFVQRKPRPHIIPSARNERTGSTNRSAAGVPGGRHGPA